MFNDTTSPVTVLFLLHVLRYHLRLTSGTFLQALSPLGNPVASQCSAADSVNAAETSVLQWQWGEAPAKDWGWSLSLLCRKGCFHFLLEPCPISWHYTSFFFQPLTSLCHLSPYGEKKSRGISCSLTTKEFLNYVLWSSKEYVLL